MLRKKGKLSFFLIIVLFIYIYRGELLILVECRTIATAFAHWVLTVILLFNVGLDNFYNFITFTNIQKIVVQGHRLRWVELWHLIIIDNEVPQLHATQSAPLN